MRSIATNVYVCLCVCPSVCCARLSQNPHVQNSRNFFCIFNLLPWRAPFSDDNAICSGFVDGVIFSNNGAYTIKIYSSACTLLWDGVEIKHGRIFKQEAVSRSLWELLVASVAAVTCRQADVVHAKLQSNDVGRDCRLCTRDWPDHPRAQRDSPGGSTDWPDHQRAGPAVLLHVRHERLQRLRIAAPPTQPAAAPPPAQVAGVGVAVAMTSRVDDVIVVTSRVGASAPRRQHLPRRCCGCCASTL